MLIFQLFFWGVVNYYSPNIFQPQASKWAKTLPYMAELKSYRSNPIPLSEYPTYNRSFIDDVAGEFLCSDEFKDICWRESRNDITAISSTQDYGIAQINKIWWDKWKVDLSKWTKNGKFTMSYNYQVMYIKMFVETQVEAIINKGLYPTNERIFQSWAGIAYVN